MEKADLVVIGAGWHGLVVAKTYAEVNPNATVILVDSAESIGGTWSKGRSYPGLRTNNLIGAYEFSDFPMDEKTFGVKSRQHIPGPVVHEYLLAYAKKFDILRRIRFNYRAETIEKKDAGWLITCKDLRELVAPVENVKPLFAQKLVIATGLTSEPFVPKFTGSEFFDAPIFHAKELRKYAEQTTKSAKSVITYGGSKSAFDAAYTYASAGVPVEWIIRKSGTGPVWMSPPYVTPLKKRLDQLVGVRLLTWFSPCVWGEYDGFARARRFLHGTSVGRWITDTFWGILSGDVVALNGLDKHPETAKLKPWTDAFWNGSSFSIFNYPTDFLQLVRDGTIKIHIADIDHLSPRTVHLADGTTVQGDALICSTGWKKRPAIKFLPEGIDDQLGIPTSSPVPSDFLVEKADAYILETFPKLANQPVLNKNYKPLAGEESAEVFNRPYRLYRFMIPPAYINDRTIGFAGAVMSIHTTLCAQAQALWLTAYFTRALPQDLLAPPKKLSEAGTRSDLESAPFNDEHIQWETVLQSRFGKWRYPAGFGAKYPDFVFDGIPYVDMLLTDLGLKHLRKGGYLKELFEPYGPPDYTGLVDEWRIETAKLIQKNQ
ncbi:MAG: hypothetical protein MMC33_003707 [Icmadophila ericetorum]|nr:hypothetical protein [Icmadophila ericetorum]